MLETELYDVGYFKCDKCPRVYQRKLSLESHILKKHSLFPMKNDFKMEGQNFFITVQEKLKSRKEKFYNQQTPQNQQMTVPRAKIQPQPQINLPSTPTNIKKGKKGKKISAADISGPTGFQHITGIKTDGTGSMQIVNNMQGLDAPLKKLFKHSGIDINQLKAEEIEEIKKSDEYQEYAEFERKKTERRQSRRSGGKPEAKDPVRSRPVMAPISENTSTPPSIPQRRNPQPPSAPNKAPPATPPRRDRNPAQKPSIPAPAPPRQTPRAPPPTLPTSKPSAGPPPPPPPPGPGPPPPPISTITIPATPQKQATPKQASAPPNDGRSDFLKQIQDGTQLRKVTEDMMNDRSSAKASSANEGGLVGALKNELVKMTHVMNYSSDEDSDNSDSDDDDDWDE